MEGAGYVSAAGLRGALCGSSWPFLFDFSFFFYFILFFIFASNAKPDSTTRFTLLTKSISILLFSRRTTPAGVAIEHPCMILPAY